MNQNPDILHTIDWLRGYDDARRGRAFKAPSANHYRYRQYLDGYNNYFEPK